MPTRIWRPLRYALKAKAEIGLISITIGVLMGAFLTLAVVAVEMSKPPVTILSASELDGVAQRGGVLDMHFRVRRDQECNSVSGAWLWRWQNVEGEKVKFVVSLGTALVTFADPAPGTQDFVFSLALPQSIEPGDWFLHQKFLDYCRLLAPLFGPVARTIPDVPIRIYSK